MYTRVDPIPTCPGGGPGCLAENRPEAGTLHVGTVGSRRIGPVRTYSHALFTWAAARHLVPSEPRVAAWGALGATLPDLPAIAGVLWTGARKRRLLTRRELCEEVCVKERFGGPDKALHSALPVAATLVLYRASGAGEPRPRAALLAFLLGWAGHALADAFTHAEDARPIFWPFSRWRFRSPISYWDRSRRARPFTLAEHAALLLVVAQTVSHDLRA